MKITTLNDIPQEGVSHNANIRKQVMLRIGDLPHLTNFSQAKFPPGEVANSHAHQDMCEVFFIESGTGIITVDNQEYALSPGTCIAINVGEIHELRNTGSTELVVTYFGLRVPVSES
ncbi:MULTISPECIES: cupin domain-containing protein [unclassified Roseofilum]|uniref:cupin domain-containing protein n=1 Tax=unclassified Roseofilum TaxID=2620099 RepID=UPI000E9E744A|nr:MULTISPECIES: cupin domain-containing protein [unclassified Roseofilum]HBR00948.1 cupin domain-containing protein [Cyanobacteria bacterium UBA11691]MBP0010052.1 cupin domain-containing protein [Roseofilum sp. Belize Diploria]MBP0012713.1 cupin domain-containing protein [Roseofilum sp. SID3]MBP0023014.1 cupin domain-containing protein [Roseofilum sp. SID2]MBP0032248.1 cupin domain-containing protein [Roseofilum sp. Belize BBD 4]